MRIIGRAAAIGCVALTMILAVNVAHANTPNSTGKDVTSKIRHEIASLPYTGIWDWIEAELRPDGTLVLKGDVLRPTTKSELESRVRTIESVTNVVNDIRVLPLSTADDEIRVRVYRSLFNWSSPLSRYSMGTNPSIHIVVANGKVTLKGAVSNAADKQIAGMAANGVFGVFSVENELEVGS